MERGDLRAAQIDLRNVVRDDPANAEAHFRLGLVQMRMSDPVAAEKEFRAARDNGFDQRSAVAALAQAYMAQGKFRELVRDFEPDPGAPDKGAAIMVLRSMALLQLNEVEAAEAQVTQAEAAEPRSAGAIYLQAVLLARAKDFTNADAALTKITTLLPRFPRGLYFLAIVKFNLGQAEQAADAATKYASRNPSDLDGVKLLARIDLATQRSDHAIEVLAKSAASGNADAEVLDLLGRAYAQGGRQLQALQNL